MTRAPVGVGCAAPRTALAFALALAVALGGAHAAGAAPVEVPLAFDAAFLRGLFAAQVFGADGELRLRSADRCSGALLREPVVAAAPGEVRVTTSVRAQVGLAAGAACWRVVGWQGELALALAPWLEPAAPVVRFRLASSEFRPGRAGLLPEGWLWRRLHPAFREPFEAVRVDLGPLVELVRAALPLFVRAEDREAAARMLDSLALARVRTDEGGVSAVLRFEAPARTAPPAAPEAPLTPAEVAALERAAADWDAFLTFVIKLAGRDASAADLDAQLLDVLLDARHELVAALAEPDARRGEDPVRALFLRTWRRLAPLLREVDGELPAEGALRYLAFLAAGDALAALDAAAPAFGLELSAVGLRRLARTLAPSLRTDPLARKVAVDPELRDVFGFGPPLPPPAPAEGGTPALPEPVPEAPHAPPSEPGLAPAPLPDAPSVEPAPGAWLRLERLAGALASLLVAPAHAAPAPADPSLLALAARLNRWAPSRTDAAEYVPLAGRLLRGIAADVGAELPRELTGLYPALYLATGWQESCWRQYVRRGRVLEPLRSSAGAVGLMQVHERVWRGFYDVDGLRFDVAYNGRAGGEILRHYLRDHAWKREEQRHGGERALARSSYAMYNGGPSQRARWRDPKTSAALRAIDDAFLEKYDALQTGDDRAVLACFSG